MSDTADNERLGMLDRLMGFCLHNKLVVRLGIVVTVLVGIAVAPFDWDIDWLPRDPVPVDAIPDIGENQQIVFSRWAGRSPQDVEDQISYPLTVAMLGLPDVKTVRSYSMFGFSMVYIIFKENVEFYWSRSRVLEKLNSLPPNSLPPGVQPMLGPDATALGQVYWYTLEGRDPDGNPTGGWDLQELRSVQDWYVRYGLAAASGIAEVASVGGYVQEYQVDVDPDAMRANGVSLNQVFAAVRNANVDVGARTIDVNNVEYVIRGRGFIRSLADIENIVVTAHDGVPIYVRNVATVSRGPALRRGALDKGGAEVVGGVAVVRYGENPLAAIKNLKEKQKQLQVGLPARIVIDFTRVDDATVRAFADAHGFAAYRDGKLDRDAWLAWWVTAPATDRPAWATHSQVTIVPFYDRTGLIYETLGTLNTALVEEILVTIIVIIVMLLHLRSSLVIGTTLPLAVLMCFIAMKTFGVDANVVALSGIAIAIGTIVDMGVIMCENILRHLDEAAPEADKLKVVFAASREVGSAVVTAILTTIVSFLPVFTMVGAEGKLFKPLAFTKTFALLASVIVALTVVPPLAHTLFTKHLPARWRWRATGKRASTVLRYVANIAVAVMVALVLTKHWLPLGPGAGFVPNAILVLGAIFGLLGCFVLFAKVYAPTLRWFLGHKGLFLVLPTVVIVWGMVVWLGAAPFVGWLPKPVHGTRLYNAAVTAFPGLGKEFMPDLDEGSYLYMPTTMPHAAIGEALDVLHKQDMALAAIPEIEQAVGKIGRADTPLDPAPISMIETVINYSPEYMTDDAGHRLRFRYDPDKVDLFRDRDGKPVPAPDGEPYNVQGTYVRENGKLVEDPHGVPFRLWRPPLEPDLNEGRAAWPGVRSPDDIWDAIVAAARVPGTTSAPKLQPIAARLVMLQSGMRAPMGIKVKGPDLQTIEAFGLELERLLKNVPSVKAAAVIADRIVGKPYMEIDIDRNAVARHGITVGQVQDVIEIAIGGRPITTTVEGRERYVVRVRYARERRDRIEDLGRILVPAPNGSQIPMDQLATLRYVRGPQVIKSEDTFLTGYVLFDRHEGHAEVDVVNDCDRYLEAAIATGDLKVPDGVTYAFAGNYQNQIRAAKTLRIVLPIALAIIFLILYFQFKAVPTTLLVFSGILVAWAGGFILIWLYGQSWFMDVALFGRNLRDVFQIHPINLSVAVWVGFLALFGIASDNGVVIATYLDQSVDKMDTDDIAGIREATVVGAERRIRPCLMTTATTILALLPVLTSTGRGSDIMVPMAIPSFGGMLLVLITVFVVPVLYCWVEEVKHHVKNVSRNR